MAPNPVTMRRLYWTSLIIVLVGAFNLGFLGLTGLNLLGAMFGGEAWLLRAIYVVIGLAGAFLLYAALSADVPTNRPARRRTY